MESVFVVVVVVYIVFLGDFSGAITYEGAARGLLLQEVSGLDSAGRYATQQGQHSVRA